MAYSDSGPLVVSRQFPLAAACEIIEDCRNEDVLEVAAMGHSLEQALDIIMDISEGKLLGGVWAVYSPKFNERCRGVFGYSKASADPNLLATGFSLWANLTYRESRQIIKETPKWLLTVLDAAKVFRLHNSVASANRAALGWLRLSKCFEVFDKVPVYGEHDIEMYPFRTVPRWQIAAMVNNAKGAA